MGLRTNFLLIHHRMATEVKIRSRKENANSPNMNFNELGFCIGQYPFLRVRSGKAIEKTTKCCCHFGNMPCRNYNGRLAFHVTLLLLVAILRGLQGIASPIVLQKHSAGLWR